MKQFTSIVLFMLAATLFMLPVKIYAFDVPTLSGPVVDEAGMISVATQRQLDSVLRHLHTEGGAQLQVLTLESLKGESIEQVSIQVVDKWKLGDKEKANGVLLLIAKEERKVRIEVGQGLEGDLPDAYAHRIIAESILPLFKSGDFSSGILVGVFQIAKRIYPTLNVENEFNNVKMPRQAGKQKFSFLVFLLIILVIGLRVLTSFGGFYRGTRTYRSGGWGSGSWGSGGGWGSSGGGWSGGGGGFSGGGASGGW